jgi:hypothetical protein
MFHVICWCFCSSYLKVAALDCDTAWFGVTCIHMGVLVVLHMVYCLIHCVHRSPIGPRYVNYDMYQTYNTHLVAKGFCIRRCIHQCYPCLLHGLLEASANGAYVIEWKKTHGERMHIVRRYNNPYAFIVLLSLSTKSQCGDWHVSIGVYLQICLGGASHNLTD